MLKNYVTIALRNLWRNKLYTFINVLGLGIGMATMVWALQNYRFSFSFDEMHPQKDSIFRVDIFREKSEIARGICPMPLAELAKEEFSSVEEFVRIDRQNIAVKSKQAQPFYENVHFIDPSFFSLFNFPLVAGSSDLTDRNSVLINETLAEKYFGAKAGSYELALGQTLSIYSGETYQKDLTVKGVVKNTPLNSSIWFNILTHFDHQYTPAGEPLQSDNWRWFVDAIFLKLSDPAEAPRLAESFKKYIGPQNAAREDWKVTGFQLEPLSMVANHNEDLWNNGLNVRPSDAAVYGPIALAIMIFLVCCLNFANTTVARSNRRLKEMGVRKVMGGTQRQLVMQMLMESAFIVSLALLVTIQLTKYALPLYNQMWQYLAIEANYFSDKTLLLFTLAMVLFTTLLAGSYPAFYISRFNPTSIFRGGVKFGGTNLFSQFLLGLQVVISLITVIASVAFSQNSEFQRTYDYGYATDDLLFVHVSQNEQFQGFMDAVKQLPGIESVAATNHHIGASWTLKTMASLGERAEVSYLQVGENYLETTGIKVLKGRAFDPEKPADFENAMLINEKLAGRYGWKADEVVGQKISIDTLTWSVIGLLKDFHIYDLFSEIEPIAMTFVKPDAYKKLVVHADPGQLNNVMDQMKAQWERLYPFTPYTGSYQNQLRAEAQLVTDNVAIIFFWFAFVSVLLTVVGLFALVSQTVVKKMKEIAIRKVVGASPGHIMLLVNKSYFWIFLVAAVIGCYGGWYSTRLLMDMIFRTNVGVGQSTLLLATFTIFLIGFVTVGMKVWQAIRTNPAEVLKGE